MRLPSWPASTRPLGAGGLVVPGRWLIAVLLPLLAIWALQRWELRPVEGAALRTLDRAQVLHDEAMEPPAALDAAAVQSLPWRQRRGGATWFAVELPPPDPAGEQLQLAFRPGLRAYLDGVLLAAAPTEPGRFMLGPRRLLIDLPPALRRQAGQRLQLRLDGAGPSGHLLDRVLLGSAEAQRQHDSRRQRWQWLRALTASSGLMVALFLALVAWVRRSEPLYALAAAHVALLALLLSPYLLPEQPLPSPWWRLLLDVADLGTKALLLVLTARLAQAWTPGLRRALLGLVGLGLLIDGSAALAGWTWSDFSHPWPWWALGSRALLLLGAWALALQALRDRGDAASWGTALLVGFSTCTWAWISVHALVLQQAVIDSHALAYAGWVLWVVVLLQRHFIDAARRDAQLQRQLATELAERSRALQQAFEAQALAERERAAAEQRRRLLQDLHDGLGARLLQLRLSAAQLDPAALQQALDDCLMEMRLSVDTLVETSGDLGVLLGSWRQRVDALMRAADVAMDWRVRASGELPCLRGGGGLELVRWLQEAMSNALRHGQPRRLIVATQWCDAAGHEVSEAGDAASLMLWFVDDGSGLPQPLRQGQGLRNLQTRAQRLGATLTLHSPAPAGWLDGGRGTALCLRLPAH